MTQPVAVVAGELARLRFSVVVTSSKTVGSFDITYTCALVGGADLTAVRQNVGNQFVWPAMIADTTGVRFTYAMLVTHAD